MNFRIHPPLPRAAPSSRGVDAAGVRAFLDAAFDLGAELHGLVIARHGAVIAEGWWEPYRPETVHSLYSLSKMFAATGVGIAVGDGAFDTEDIVIDLLGLPRAAVTPGMEELTVEHLLTMSAGTDYSVAVRDEDDWVGSFLRLPLPARPGTRFVYDGTATYLLSAVVQAATGRTLADLLRDRLFDPLGVADARWLSCPRGITTGGWGLSVTTETIAKLGLLYLNGGEWQGRRILTRDWVTRALSPLVASDPSLGGGGPVSASDRERSDWHQGYGYHVWTCRHDAVRGDGAFGQFCILLPEQDAVVAITSRTGDLQGLLDLVWRDLLPAFDAGTGSAADDGDLAARLRDAALPVSVGTAASDQAGGTFRVDPHPMGVSAVEVEIASDAVTLRFERGSGATELVAGFGEWRHGELDLPGGPPELHRVIGRSQGIPAVSRIAAVAAWADPSTLVITVRYVETPHRDTVTCRFVGDTVVIEFLNSLTADALAAYPHVAPSAPETRPPLTGRR